MLRFLFALGVCAPHLLLVWQYACTGTINGWLIAFVVLEGAAWAVQTEDAFGTSDTAG
jgi:hypothetical protein